MSGVREVLRRGPFRWFFAGRAVATLGNQVSPVALAFAVLSLSGSEPQRNRIRR